MFESLAVCWAKILTIHLQIFISEIRKAGLYDQISQGLSLSVFLPSRVVCCANFVGQPMRPSTPAAPWVSWETSASMDTYVFPITSTYLSGRVTL
jgi:hypothetical protein